MVEITFSQEDIELYLLILVRISSFIFIAPFFSQANSPVRIRLGLAIFISIILYLVLPLDTLEYSTLLEYTMLVLKESVVGLLIGFSAQICNNIILFSGKIIDIETGMSMAQVYDPQTNMQVSITGNLYSYTILMLLIATNMHTFLLNAIVDSYEVIPIGEAVFSDSLQDTFVEFVASYFIIGFEICLPVFAMGILLNAVLGIMAKVAPQMNMFAVGIQIKIMVGILIIFLTAALLPTIANIIFDQMRVMVVDVIKGMS